MQTAIEQMASRARSETIRVMYVAHAPEDRLLPAPHYWGADYYCRDVETLDRLLAAKGYLFHEGVLREMPRNANA